MVGQPDHRAPPIWHSMYQLRWPYLQGVGHAALACAPNASAGGDPATSAASSGRCCSTRSVGPAPEYEGRYPCQVSCSPASCCHPLGRSHGGVWQRLLCHGCVLILRGWPWGRMGCCQLAAAGRTIPVLAVANCWRAASRRGLHLCFHQFWSCGGRSRPPRGRWLVASPICRGRRAPPCSSSSSRRAIQRAYLCTSSQEDPLQARLGDRPGRPAISSVPWHRQNPWAASWSGITPNGMSQHTSYTQGCCLASPLPSLRSTVFLACWRACVVDLEGLCNHHGPRSATGSGQWAANEILPFSWISSRFWEATVYAVRRHFPGAHSWLQHGAALQLRLVLGQAADFMKRSKTSSTLLETQLAFLEVSHRRSTEWPIFWSRGFSVE